MKNRMTPLTELTDTISLLPRGGFLIDSKIGYIQFGAPPETIKDTMLLPKGAPLIYVLPSKFFNWIKGISIAELEFPIYYNFFIKKKKTKIVCQKNHINRLKILLQESLFGPIKENFFKDYIGKKNFIKDVQNEMAFFRTMEMDDVVEFLPFSKNNLKIKNIKIKIDENKNFSVYENDTLLAHVPGQVSYKPRYFIGERLAEPYIPPLFGMTCLGSSSGFDPYENTSGFVLWINHNGVMIDPPVNSTEWLLDSNVNPKFIDSIILTHCHADHDAGTFQKILEEGRITVYTTKTILMSFLRKYSALIDVTQEYLLKLFDFHEIKIGAPIFIHGAKFDMFYSLHSIPTMGFKVKFQNKTLTYSSDHNSDLSLQKKLLKDKIISKERFDDLQNFPWDSDVIFHESGVAPLHTPLEFLKSLPEKIQNKLNVYHIPVDQVASEKILKHALFGIEHSLTFDVKPPIFENAYKILGLLKHLDFAEDITINKAQKFISIVEEESFQKGDKIISKGSPGNKFFIIFSGNVSVHGNNKYFKIFGAYDYFGEAALINDKERSADVFAETDVILYSIEKEKFLDFFAGSSFIESLKHLIKNRDEEAWEIFSISTSLKILTSTQRTLLESQLVREDIPKTKLLLDEDKIQKNFYIIRKGKISVSKGKKTVKVLERGDIIGSVKNIYYNLKCSSTFKIEEDLSVYKIEGKKIKSFIDRYPGLLMKLSFD